MASLKHTGVYVEDGSSVVVLGYKASTEQYLVAFLDMLSMYDRDELLDIVSSPDAQNAKYLLGVDYNSSVLQRRAHKVSGKAWDEYLISMMNNGSGVRELGKNDVKLTHPNQYDSSVQTTSTSVTETASNDLSELVSLVQTLREDIDTIKSDNEKMIALIKNL